MGRTGLTGEMCINRNNVLRQLEPFHLRRLPQLQQQQQHQHGHHQHQHVHHRHHHHHHQQQHKQEKKQQQQHRSGSKNNSDDTNGSQKMIVTSIFTGLFSFLLNPFGKRGNGKCPAWTLLGMNQRNINQSCKEVMRNALVRNVILPHTEKYHEPSV